MKTCVEHIFNGLTTPISAYDSTKTNLGTLMRQYNLGSGITQNFVGPIRMATVAKPMEASTAVAVANPNPFRITDTLDHVYFCENSAAAATRRLVMYTFNRDTSVWAWQGFVTLTFPTATNHTIRGFEMTRDLYTTGTVAVSGTAVTGSGSTWTTDGMSVGSRIGFGSTDPSQISTWYEISAVGSNTGITLTASAGTIGAGASYVIEDYRANISTTNATAANGGLFVVKGLRPELFTSVGTAIGAATTTDNLRAVYWLADASTVLNTVAAGCTVEDKTSWTSQFAYVLDTSGRVYKYNVRASLAGLASGKSTSAFVFRTGVQALVGTMSQANNGVIATAGHGAGMGVSSLYFVTTTRVYRCAVSNITDASTTWTSDAMVEVPPGSVTTYTATGALGFIEYSAFIDKFIVISTGASGNRSYVTSYNTTSDQFDQIFLVDAKNLDQNSADSDSANFPSINASQFSSWSEGGLLFLCRNGTTAALNQVYAVPVGAHWGWAANQSVITPSLSLAGATKLHKLYVNENTYAGEGTFRVPREVYRVYYRTGGITDNSGGWSLLDDGKDLSGISPSSNIQFKFEFRVLGLHCIPSQINSLAVVYETGDTLPSQYAWYHSDSNNSDGTVGFIQKTLFSTAVPVHTINYYRADTNALVLTQASSGTTNGNFQYWDGDSWENGLGTDTLNLRRRFVPTAGLPTGVDIYVKLSTT
jgi:hypothetical protein